MTLDFPTFHEVFSKSIEKRSENAHYCENELSLFILDGNTQDEGSVTFSPPSHSIQFYFAPADEISFQFSPTYSHTLGAEMYFLLYSPERPLSITLDLQEGQQVACLFVSVEKLHQLFVHDLDSLPFLKGDQMNRPFREHDAIQTDLKMVLAGCFSSSRIPSHRQLYFKGKIFEILSYFFSQRNDDQEACPFLESEGSVAKIRMAKQIVSERLYDPPTLAELSSLIDMNEYQLKAGFKKVFGASVFGYIQNQKMIQARQMLDTGTMRVKEVSTKVGYSNASHFIVAFKRSFGVTPKKYLLARAAAQSSIPQKD